jgi:hypothetical protein
MKTRGSGGIAPPFLSSALDGGEWSASRPGRLTLGEKGPGTHRIEGCVGHRAGLLDTERRNKAPIGIRSRSVQLVVRRYTD